MFNQPVREFIPQNQGRLDKGRSVAPIYQHTKDNRTNTLKEATLVHKDIYMHILFKGNSNCFGRMIMLDLVHDKSKHTHQ